MSTKTPKVAPLSETANAVLEALKAKPEGATLAELKNVVEGANSAHLVALRTRGLVTSEEIEVEVVKTSKAKVLKYTVKGE